MIYSHFKFVENSGNNEFSNGYNLSASLAAGDNLLFLNPDTKINSKAIETLLQTYATNPKIGILSCS